uniref:Yippee domain-containing protein n=1 Tax=Setaria viridis TaxID=4556 RepID=A0A4U6SYH9_SETVI|nr:putative yippee-like protein Os10g0369500 isoform X1 [Setaria viridis]TKV94090.1 hypothetical protein SEVIR_9G271100v2 [Setaria viridis]
MGLLFVQVLPRGNGDPGSPAATVLQCRRCRLDAASMGAILSREFQGRIGRGYLFDRVVNITLGPNEDREFTTGPHIVNDIYCICCQEIIGWRYSRVDNNFIIGTCLTSYMCVIPSSVALQVFRALCPHQGTSSPGFPCQSGNLFFHSPLVPLWICSILF